MVEMQVLLGVASFIVSHLSFYRLPPLICVPSQPTYTPSPLHLTQPHMHASLSSCVYQLGWNELEQLHYQAIEEALRR